MEIETNIPKRILMGPGPSNANPRVLNAMSRPLIGHLDPEFLKIMDQTKEMLRTLFKTKNEMTFPISAPASAAMECCIVNLLEPGDTALICVNGVFGQRMCENVERCGAKLIRVDAPWGQPIDPELVETELIENKPKLVCIVHAETSTGLRQPLEEIGKLAKDYDALFLVDAVTSLAGIDVQMDNWKIDAIYSGTQKCLSAPPGLSPVSFSENALQKIRNRQSKVQSWFLDINLLDSYWSGEKRAYHHTAPVSSIFALHEALKIVLEEGLENRFKRHQQNHELLKEGLEKLGFEFVVDEAHRLPQLNAVKIPAGVDDAKVRSQLLNEFNIEIGAGLGEFAGKVWRIGLMGESSQPEYINQLLEALKKLIK